MNLKGTYIPRVIRPSSGTKESFQPGSILVARYKQKELYWCKSHRRYYPFEGYTLYTPGHYELRDGSGQEPPLILTPIQPGYLFDPEDTPKLTKAWVSRINRKIRETVDPNWPEFEYRRGYAFVA